MRLHLCLLAVLLAAVPAPAHSATVTYDLNLGQRLVVALGVQVRGVLEEHPGQVVAARVRRDRQPTPDQAALQFGVDMHCHSSSRTKTLSDQVPPLGETSSPSKYVPVFDFT